MKYESTREGTATLLSSQAILAGLAPDGGLYTPETIPSVSARQLEELLPLSYQDRAMRILSLYLDDFSSDDLETCIHEAYSHQSFSHPEVAPVRSLSPDLGILELWHGPTCAFKDIALQILPHLLITSARMQQDDRTYVILVATSGDTGKAALEGFRDVDRTRILVFYPHGGVSQIQKLQMVTQEGNNVGVAAVTGNFDDTQTGVKAIFSDPEIRGLLDDHEMRFSSANSINWGRLAPQIVYYFSAYCDMVNAGSINAGDLLNFVVPTGNFGNILAGYLAREMGLPVGRLICAANSNNVLTDFIRTGVYDRNRPFHRTISPSMDILISSNLERLIYLMSGRDAGQIRDWMDQLNATGRYQVDGALQEAISGLFWSDYSTDEETIQRIAQTYRDQNYLMDTHTAVAMDICERYRTKTGDATPAVVVSTASPFKFADSVARAILPPALREGIDEVELLKRISAESEQPIPPALSGLDSRPIRHDRVIDRPDMAGAVKAFLQL